MQTPTKKQKLKVGGLRPPTFNNNLDYNNFGFNKPICKFDNNKFDNDLVNELIMKKKEKTDNIQHTVRQEDE